MSYRAGLFTGILIAAVAGGLGWLASAAVRKPSGDKASAKPTPPATLVKPAKEDEFNRITLTPEAEKRLGIRTAAVERKPAPRSRNLGGDVTIPPGRAIAVAAPVGGLLKAPEGGAPRAGQAVKKGQAVFQLLPLLTPEARTTLATTRVEAEGLVKNAETQFDAAKIALDRATRLLRDEAGSRRAVDEAQAAYDLARKTLDAARARLEFLARAVGDADKGTSTPIPIEAPEDGILRTVSALSDQTVPSGAALFEVIDLSRVWLRVPVYVGDLSEVAADKEASAGTLTGKPGDRKRPARPTPAPPSANPLAGTVDLFYEVDNSDNSLSPGERVAVSVPLKGEESSLVVPWSAVIHDIQGGTWVYENVAEHTYVRRRVQVRHVAGDLAVLATGPAPGTKVVAEGAAEVFGTEVGFSK